MGSARRLSFILAFAVLSLSLLPGTDRVQAAPTTNILPGSQELDLQPRVYLPLVANSRPVELELVVTSLGNTIGYPNYHWVRGYVRNLTSEPFYSVTVEMDVTFDPYEPPYGSPSLPPHSNEPDHQLAEVVRVSPALTATLPGQINPFYYSLTLGKASAWIGEVRLGTASRTEPHGVTYHPVTVVAWEYEGTTIFGTARNDTSQVLHHVRVVAAEIRRCSWREAALDDMILAPGQETDFHLDLGTTGCVTDHLLVVGQGADQP